MTQSSLGDIFTGCRLQGKSSFSTIKAVRGSRSSVAFDTSSPDELRLYWKDRGGWRSTETTAFGLNNPVRNVSEHITASASFYFEGAIKDVSYVGRILRAEKARSNVSKISVSGGSVLICPRTI